MVNATLTYMMKLEVVTDNGDWSPLKCSSFNSDNVLITEIRLFDVINLSSKICPFCFKNKVKKAIFNLTF